MYIIELSASSRVQLALKVAARLCGPSCEDYMGPVKKATKSRLASSWHQRIQIDPQRQMHSFLIHPLTDLKQFTKIILYSV